MRHAGLRHKQFICRAQTQGGENLCGVKSHFLETRWVHCWSRCHFWFLLFSAIHAGLHLAWRRRLDPTRDCQCCRPGSTHLPIVFLALWTPLEQGHMINYSKYTIATLLRVWYDTQLRGINVPFVTSQMKESQKSFRRSCKQVEQEWVCHFAYNATVIEFMKQLQSSWKASGSKRANVCSYQITSSLPQETSTVRTCLGQLKVTTNQRLKSKRIIAANLTRDA